MSISFVISVTVVAIWLSNSLLFRDENYQIPKFAVTELISAVTAFIQGIRG